jgi:hypothetical protein
VTPDTERRNPGRSLTVRAFGDTANEIELYALDEARAFFGDDIKLTVERDYVTSAISSASRHTLPGEVADKKYLATVLVRADG